MKEQITNLPWVLETVAKQLDKLAEHLKEQQEDGNKFAATPKAVEAALLKALAAAEDESSASTKDLVDCLKNFEKK